MWKSPVILTCEKRLVTFRTSVHRTVLKGCYSAPNPGSVPPEVSRPASTACGVSRSLLFTWSPGKVRASLGAPARTLWIRKPLQQDSDCRNQLFYPASQLEGQNTQIQKYQSVMKARQPCVLPAVNEFSES